MSQTISALHATIDGWPLWYLRMVTNLGSMMPCILDNRFGSYPWCLMCTPMIVCDGEPPLSSIAERPSHHMWCRLRRSPIYIIRQPRERETTMNWTWFFSSLQLKLAKALTILFFHGAPRFAEKQSKTYGKTNVPPQQTILTDSSSDSRPDAVPWNKALALSATPSVVYPPQWT